MKALVEAVNVSTLTANNLNNSVSEMLSYQTKQIENQNKLIDNQKNEFAQLLANQKNEFAQLLANQNNQFDQILDKQNKFNKEAISEQRSFNKSLIEFLTKEKFQVHQEDVQEKKVQHHQNGNE